MCKEDPYAGRANYVLIDPSEPLPNPPFGFTLNAFIARTEGRPVAFVRAPAAADDETDCAGPWPCDGLCDLRSFTD